MAARTARCHRSAAPVSSRAATRPCVPTRTRSQAIMRRRRSTRSAQAPPKSEKNANGTLRAASTAPSSPADACSSRAANGRAIRNSALPSVEPRWAAKSRANGRSCKAAGRYRDGNDFGLKEGSEMATQETGEQQLWGGETTKAVANFPVSGERVPVSVVRWLGRIKAAAARTNAELGKLDRDIAERIAAAGDRVPTGDYDDQFPIDVFQTGSGTSSNMNANEVLANLAGEGVHANDHVNYGQSSNDVFPSAVHLAALDDANNRLLPALDALEGAFAAKAEEFSDIVKAGRTHLMDAVPVTLGQEFAGYAAQIRLGARRVRNALPQVAQIPLGGTATGNGLNTHPKFAEGVRARLNEATGLDIAPPEDPFEAQANRDALVELSGALKVVAVSLTKIANDLALMGSGPRAGIGEIFLPELQKGSSIMPGKVNPVLPEVVLQVSAQVIGNDTAITIGGLQGQFELNVRIPLIARNLLQSIHLLSTTSVAFAEKCIDGIEVNKEGTKRSAGSTLAVATALNPYIGYDKAAEIVKEAAESGRLLREVALDKGVDAKTFDEAIDMRKIAAGNIG